MGETDVTFRRLLRGLPRPLLQLAFPERRLRPIGPPIDPSVDRARQLTTDNLFRVRDGSSEAVIHFEIERDWRPGIPRRLFGYASAAVMATALPVWSLPGQRPASHVDHEGPRECQFPGAPSVNLLARVRGTGNDGTKIQ